MAQVMNVQRTPQNNGQKLALIGTAVGAAYGNPGAGGAIGGAVGGASDAQANQAGPSSVQTGNDAMSRRMQSMDNLTQLREAQQAISQLPPEQQKQYADPINQAYMMEAKKRGMV